MAQGTIKKLIADKGFGFIEGEKGDLFFHHSAVVEATIETLQVGQEASWNGSVSFLPISHHCLILLKVSQVAPGTAGEGHQH